MIVQSRNVQVGLVMNDLEKQLKGKKKKGKNSVRQGTCLHSRVMLLTYCLTARV